MPFKDPAKRREYQRKYQAKWYAANKDKQLESNKAIKQRYKQWWREFKSSLSCSRCGENHPATLDFHHSDPSEKEFDIHSAVSRGWGKQRILDEIERCEVLCANCHRKHHWEEKE